MPKNRLNQNQTGFASVVVALTVITVIALLTVAFAQLARREEQNALDKQLALQAYYAAESGVNDVVKNLASIPDTNDPTQCVSNTILTSSTINTSTGVSYTCALVNKEPWQLEYSNVDPTAGKSATFTTSDTLNSLTIQWGSENRNNFCDLTNKFPPKSTWDTKGCPAVVQFSITPTSSLNRTNLINNTFTAYLYPQGGSGSNTVSASSGNGQIIPGNCSNSTSTTYPCKVTITGLSGTSYVIHFVTYYADKTDLFITGSNNSSGSIKFIKGQAVIDVTGKARNVLKRLQVVVPLSGNDGGVGLLPVLPDNAIEAQNLCKRQQTEPGGTSFVTITTNANATGSDICNLEYVAP